MNVSELDYQLPDKNTLQIMHTVPLCSFTKVVLDRSTEFADVYTAEKDNYA